MTKAESVPSHSFKGGLILNLQLKVGTQQATIEAGNIKAFTIEQTSFGADVAVRFWIVSIKSSDEDKFVSHYLKDTPIDATLTLKRSIELPGTQTNSWVIQGLVYERELFEQDYPAVTGEPVLQREYSLRFADPAWVLWRQHHPVALYVDKSLKDILAEHAKDRIKMTTTWKQATTKEHVHSLALGSNMGEASFYDFIHWYATTRHGFIYYDSQNKKYELSADKKDQGQAQDLSSADIDDFQIVFPAVNRTTVTVHNSFAKKTSSTTITNSASATGVREDFVITSPASSVATTLKTRATARQTSADPILQLTWTRLPTVNIQPGCLLKFNSNDWSSKRLNTNKTYRVFRVRMDAKAINQGATDDRGQESNIYTFGLDTKLELKESKTQRAAPHIRPTWPLRVEAVVQSGVGGKKDLTYQPVTDEKASVDTYKLQVGLFKKQILRAPYRPQTLSNHAYVPLYKGQRVILNLSFQKAEISRLLDWRAGAKVPGDSQGNHLLMGKSDLGHTSMLYTHVDNKPEFSITRTVDKDKQVLELKDGVIVFETS